MVLLDLSRLNSCTVPYTNSIDNSIPSNLTLIDLMNRCISDDMTTRDVCSYIESISSHLEFDGIILPWVNSLAIMTDIKERLATTFFYRKEGSNLIEML